MKHLKFFYLISFLEGAALMAAELISAKLMAPFYGTSLTVWTTVFVVTLSALAFGYFLGAKISLKNKLEDKLFYILAVSGIFFLMMFPLSQFIMNNTLNLNLILGSLLSVFIFLFPLLVAFGIVSPLIIKIITLNSLESGKKASLVYTISTIGGILATMLFGISFIPEYGIKNSIFIASSFIFVATGLIFLIKNKL